MDAKFFEGAASAKLPIYVPRAVPVPETEKLAFSHHLANYWPYSKLTRNDGSDIWNNLTLCMASLGG